MVVRLSSVLIFGIVFYVAFVVFFCVISRSHASRRYDEAKEKIKVYKEYVNKLNEIYDEEESL